LDVAKGAISDGQYFFAPFHQILISRPLGGADKKFRADSAISRHAKQFFPERYTQKVNHKKVLLHKPKLLFFKLLDACQVYCCLKMACDVTDFEAYWSWNKKAFYSFSSATTGSATSSLAVSSSADTGSAQHSIAVIDSFFGDGDGADGVRDSIGPGPPSPQATRVNNTDGILFLLSA
jgi:hypothetical protein